MRARNTADIVCCAGPPFITERTMKMLAARIVQVALRLADAIISICANAEFFIGSNECSNEMAGLKLVDRLQRKHAADRGKPIAITVAGDGTGQREDARRLRCIEKEIVSRNIVP